MSKIIIRRRFIRSQETRAFYSDEKADKLLFIMSIKIIFIFLPAIVSLGFSAEAEREQ